MKIQPTIYVITEHPKGAQPLAVSYTSAEVTLAYTVDGMGQKQLLDLYRFMSPLDHDRKYCLAFTAEQLKYYLNQPELASFFFLPQYDLSAFRPIIVVIGKAGEQMPLQPTLDALAKDHGLDGVVIRQVSLENIFTGEAENETLETKVSREYQHCISTNSNDPVFYIRNGQASFLNDLIHACLSAEQSIASKNEAVYKQFVNGIQLKRRLQIAEHELDITTRELKSMEVVVNALRQKHQAKEIKDFYYNEYEVLPLWYKRFGHIIKMITGKRSVRSIYNKQVPKYKT